MYFVKRKQGNVIVSIMYNRVDSKYHFVNLTKNHICVCGFDTVEDAVSDMEKLKRKGELVDFVKLIG